MTRRKIRIAPSSKRRPGRQTPSGTAALSNEQTTLDKWLSSGSAAQWPSSLVEAQEIIQDAQEKEDKEQNAAIIVAIKRLYTFPPWNGQREALHHLVFLRKDMILIAKTSFGKSMILQAVSLLLKKTITLFVLPLNQIGVEQTECIKSLGGRPCFLNADTITAELLEEVKAAKYTHVLLSPELAIGDAFRAIVTHPQFRERLGLVAVDEAHLVAHWGRAFRTEYARMHQLRALLGRNVPWFACSATLDPATLETVRQGCAFLPDVKVQRTSINRPELLLRLGRIPKNKYLAFTALRFLFKEGEVIGAAHETAHLNIPKSVVFFDTKNEVHEALEKCREWLETSEKHQYTRRQIQSTIRAFHRNTAQHDKETTIAEFRQLAMGASARVIFATEALGVGVNIRDIRRVIQYGIPKGYHPAVAWQRGGRGSRDGQDGEIILLVEEWAFGPRDEAAAQKYAWQLKNHRSKQNPFPNGVAEEPNKGPAEDLNGEGALKQDQRAKSSSDKERRERLPAFWYHLINAGGCIRKQFLDFFDEINDSDNPTRKERCCSHCNPEFALGDLDLYYLYSEKGPSSNKKRKLIAEDLERWAWSKCEEIPHKENFLPNAGCILTKSQRVELARYADQTLVKEDILSRLGSWRWYDRFGQSLYEQLREAHYTRERSVQTPTRLLANIQTLANSKHVPDDSSQFSERSNLTWSAALTPDSISQSTPYQNFPVSPCVDINTPSQDDTDMPPPSATPVPKRKALSVISGNRPRRMGSGKN